MKIIVNYKGEYCGNLRDDLDCKDYYSVDSVFETIDNEEGSSDTDDVVRMFIKACELEGYEIKSICNSLYKVALLEAYNNDFKLQGEEIDTELINFNYN